MKKWSTKEPKFWKVMRLCAVQAVLAMVLFGASIAHDGAGQVLDKRLTLEVKDATLESILEKIEDQVGVKFVYNPSFFNLQEKISIVRQDASLKDVLNELFEARHIEYQIYEKELAITLRKSKKDSSQSLSTETHLKVASIITGRVTGGTPPAALAGVNVLIKGTTTGTTTDAEGRYSLQADRGDRIVFSFIGFVSAEVDVDDRTVIDVALIEDSKSLSEVEVKAGYWTVTKEELTGNIARITQADIKSQPVNNPLLALAGRMPGVMISQETGMPGGGVQVLIRGRNSIANGNDPLYIIDGIPVTSTSLKSSSFGAAITSGNPFSTINPNDVESIEVLKDGAATAIYGSRGANGVILITTKKGTAGKTKFEVNVATGVAQVGHMMKLLNTNDYLAMRRQAFKNDNRIPTTANAADLLLWDTTRNVDWQQKLLGGTAHTTNVNATLSGGEKNTTFLVSLGYYKEGTVFPGDYAYRRGSGSLAINHKSADGRLNVSLSTNYQVEDNNLPSSDITSSAIGLAPNSPEPYINGQLNWGPNSSFNNPYVAFARPYNVKTNNFRNNLQVDYRIIPGLTIRANVGYTKISTEDYSAIPIPANNPIFGVTTGVAYFGRGSNDSWITEPQVEYKKEFGSHSFTTLVGTTFQQSARFTNTISGTGYTNDLLLDNMQGAPVLTVLDATETQYRYDAVYGRLNYNYNRKYFIEFVGRRDGSSRFGADHRFANFGSVSGAWLFSSEEFVKQSLNFLSFGKLRASYGTVGNDQIGDYGYLDTYSTVSLPYQGTTVLTPTRLANPAYSWESNKKLEVGIELGFFHDRLMASVSYFSNRSSNQLVGLPLSGVTGFTTIQANMAALVENRGLEIEINSINVKTGRFEWATGLNLTIPRNELLEFPNLESSTYASRLVVGQSTNIDKVFRYVGVNPQTGVYQFEDVNGDLAISSPGDNKTVIDKNPTLFGGMSNNFRYKNWTLNTFFQFVQQKTTSYLGVFSLPGALKNQPEEITTRWQKAGDISNVQQVSTTTATAAYPAFLNAVNSERNYEDNSFIRLKNVYLSYTFPRTVTDKLKLKGSEVYLQGQNLFTITSFKGFDPETRAYSALPPLRTIAFGVRITL